MRTLAIIGAGGHGLVVSDAAKAMGVWHRICFIDQKYPAGGYANNIQIISNNDIIKLHKKHTEIIVAIGDNKTRLSITNKYLDQGYKCATIIHPRAWVSSSANISEGTVIMANAVVNSMASISKGSIINTNATIEHECSLGAGVHVSPNACLAGNVTVGDCSWIGASSTVTQGCNIGAYVIVGAGSVVISDVINEKQVVGVPAKEI